MIIKTEINLDFQKKLKKRGYIYSSFGALLLFLGANVLSIQTLEQVGLWIFLTAIVCIYLGLKPYSEAKKRIFFPDELLIKKENLSYLQNKKISLTIPVGSIASIRYKDRKNQFGIFVLTKNNSKGYFFPYFPKKEFDRLLSHSALQNIMHSD